MVNGKVKHVHKSGGDAVYGLGLIGALIFYVQQSEGLWQFIVAILKALVWPAFVVYDLLKYLNF